MSDNHEVVISKLLYNNETCFLHKPDFSVHKGELVIIETTNGPEIGVISGISCSSPENPQIGNILRHCTEEDLEKKKKNEKREKEAFDITLEKINKHGLDMKLVNVHYFLDDTKIIFNFTADGRVDFRELVKDLASVFKKRIELRQIGARDEAKIIKGFGICGREFCCNSIKNELQPVTIKMAKDQNLTLNSSKISGACGRLLCCLAYEHDVYSEIKKQYPPEGSNITYEDRQVELMEINILKNMATLKTEEEIIMSVPLEYIPRKENKHNQEKVNTKTSW